MVSYDFYQNTYLGSAIAQGVWKSWEARARQRLEALEHKYTLIPYGPDSRDMAVCAIAETLYEFRKKWFVAKETVGGVSVSYEADTEALLNRKLLQDARGYLQVYRGVV